MQKQNFSTIVHQLNINAEDIQTFFLIKLSTKQKQNQLMRNNINCCLSIE